MKSNSPGGEEVALPTIRIGKQILRRTITIPSELLPYRDVAIYPRAQGFVKAIYVDRGSIVKQNQILVEVSAPELEANFRESQARVDSARSALIEVESRVETLKADKAEADANMEAKVANFKRIQFAAQTPGAIAPADIDEAQQSVAAAKAHSQAAARRIVAEKSKVEVFKASAKASEQALQSVSQIRSYLTVRAPFSGVITERNVHEGSLVSSATSNPPMVRIQDVSKLRLTVPVPETAVAGVSQGKMMTFTVPAFVGKKFSARIQRISHGLDRKSRTMAIELDVPNTDLALEPGMYAEVVWQMERPYQTLFAPASSVLSANDRTNLIRVSDGKAEVVPVTRGQTMNDYVEVVGDIHAGDEILVSPSDDIVSGMKVRTHLLSALTSEENHEH
ncbi:MAG: efflux RND transporter periplasmic adaptor subunit [Candidatus Melainabacteria bacterium]|nr:efflux RND transporter periplasmic adaptor subunit [Candidatus Melainabacteria bacterium]